MKTVNRIFALLSAVLLIGAFCFSASAESGTVTVTLNSPDNNVHGSVTIALYQTAEYTQNGLVLTDDFSGSGLNLGELKNTAAAEALYAYARDNALTCETKTASVPGSVTFGPLQPGLYLIASVSGQDDEFEPIVPVLLTVPFTSDDGETTLDVRCEPKLELKPTQPPTDAPRPTDVPTEAPTEEQPTQITTEPQTETSAQLQTESPTQAATEPASEEKLPQTGMVMWPVPVFACTGLLLFALGWALRFLVKERE